MAQHGLTPSGPAFALYHRAPDETADFEVGMPLTEPRNGSSGVSPAAAT
jgi:hypothetical protein